MHKLAFHWTAQIVIYGVKLLPVTHWLHKDDVLATQHIGYTNCQGKGVNLCQKMMLKIHSYDKTLLLRCPLVMCGHYKMWHSVEMPKQAPAHFYEREKIMRLTPLLAVLNIIA